MTGFRPSFTITLTTWGDRTVVGFEPRRVNMPSRPFRDALTALSFAESISRKEKWPIEDRRALPDPSAS